MGEIKHVSFESPEVAGCGPFLPPADSPDSLRLSIFERIRAMGAVSRATIAKDLMISPGTVTTQTSALIEMGLIRELPGAHEAGETGRGRPPIALGVEPDAHVVAGLKLSDLEHTAVIHDFAGRQIASATMRVSENRSPECIVDSTAELVEDVCRSAGIPVSKLSAVGIGVPGFVDPSKGMVHWSPVMECGPLPFAALMSDRLGLPVTIDNDANLVALAELWFGVGRQISNFAVVTIEHGVGMGLVMNHKLYRGARGMGMELGHTKVALDGALCRCGQRGCLEAYVADYALVREAAVATNAPIAASTEVPEVLERLYADAKAGNAAARSIFERAGKYLALGMGNVLNLFDPQLVILSGGRMQYEYLYSSQMLDEMASHALNSGVAAPPVEVHAWGDLVWASGASTLALSYVTEAQLSVRAGTAA